MRPELQVSLPTRAARVRHLLGFIAIAGVFHGLAAMSIWNIAVGLADGADLAMVGWGVGFLVGGAATWISIDIYREHWSLISTPDALRIIGEELASEIETRSIPIAIIRITLPWRFPLFTFVPRQLTPVGGQTESVGGSPDLDGEDAPTPSRPLPGNLRQQLIEAFDEVRLRDPRLIPGWMGEFDPKLGFEVRETR